MTGHNSSSPKCLVKKFFPLCTYYILNKHKMKIFKQVGNINNFKRQSNGHTYYKTGRLQNVHTIYKCPKHFPIIKNGIS